MEEKMEQHPRKSRAKLAAYIVCFVLSVLCATILLIAAALLFYYTSLLAHIWSSSNIPAFSQNIVQNTSTADTHSSTKPNIVIILADDLGWNDVSFHGYSDISTPNIDRLAREGIILNSFYSQQACTPSRSALMSGRYPIRYGFQHRIISNGEPRGLPLSEKLLPEYLKELGYETHLVGKWHLGYYRKSILPTRRGFDSFFGSHGSSIHHFEHTFNSTMVKKFYGLDLWNNTAPAPEYVGQYITNVLSDKATQRIEDHDFSKPLYLQFSHVTPHVSNGETDLQVPQEYVNRFTHIMHGGRRKYAGIVSALDDSVGDVFTALQNKNVLNNTIILFLSDNGGGGQEQFVFPNKQSTYGNNWPLRGAKNTFFEGGVRVVAAVWSPLLRNSNRVSTELYHITDLLPTFVHVAGGTVDSSAGLDGINIWTSLSEDLPSSRTELLIQADATAGEYALRWNQYKIISGLYVDKEGESADDWYEPSGGLNQSLITDIPGALRCGNSSRNYCDPNFEPCLFDVVSDPCERNNIAADYPEIIRLMMEKIRLYNTSAVLATNGPTDPNSDPSYQGGLLAPWED